MSELLSKDDIFRWLDDLKEKEDGRFPPTDVRSYTMAPPHIEVPIDELDFEELKRLSGWEDAPSRECCLAYFEIKGIKSAHYLHETRTELSP